MSDTPRTDAITAWWPHSDCAPEEVVSADFARQLERESARRRDRIERLRGLCKTAVGMLRDCDAWKEADQVASLIGDIEPTP